MPRRSQSPSAPAAPTSPAAAASAGSLRAYLNTEEAARIVRLSPRTLERLRTHGTGPRYPKPGKGVRSRVLYRLQDLEAWVEAVHFASTSEYGLQDTGGRR